MKTTMMKSIVCAAAALGLACGGSVTKKAAMTSLAADAPPPPSGGGPAKPRAKVSREAKADFAEAAKAHKAAAQDGWTANECNSMATMWKAVADDHNGLIEARYNVGVSYQMCKMMRDAEAEYQTALKKNPAHGPSLSNLGTIYFLGGNRDRAKEYWEKAEKVDTTLSVTGARANLAWLMIENIRAGGSLSQLEKQASARLSRALAVEFENQEAYVMYALLYLEGSAKNKSRLALADLLLDKAQEIDDKYPALHNARGLYLLERDDVANALVAFRRAVQLDPSFADAQLNVGNIVLDFRKYDEAAAAFSAVLKLRPKEYDAHIGLGISKRGLKDFDGAEAAYKQALRLDASQPAAEFNLGVLYQDFRANQTQDLRQAKTAYQTAAKYFRQAQSKPGADRELKNEAAENIKVCEKNIKTLDEALAQP